MGGQHRSGGSETRSPLRIFPSTGHNIVVFGPVPNGVSPSSDRLKEEPLAWIVAAESATSEDRARYNLTASPRRHTIDGSQSRGGDATDGDAMAQSRNASCLVDVRPCFLAKPDKSAHSPSDVFDPLPLLRSLCPTTDREVDPQVLGVSRGGNAPSAHGKFDAGKGGGRRRKANRLSGVQQLPRDPRLRDFHSEDIFKFMLDRVADSNRFGRSQGRGARNESNKIVGIEKRIHRAPLTAEAFASSASEIQAAIEIMPRVFEKNLVAGTSQHHKQGVGGEGAPSDESRKRKHGFGAGSIHHHSAWGGKGLELKPEEVHREMQFQGSAPDIFEWDHLVRLLKVVHLGEDVMTLGFGSFGSDTLMPDCLLR